MYGLSAESLDDIIRAHKIARRIDNSATMAHLEDALTSINYYTIRDLMHDGLYDKAVEMHRQAVQPVRANQGADDQRGDCRTALCASLNSKTAP